MKKILILMVILLLSVSAFAEQYGATDGAVLLYNYFHDFISGGTLGTSYVGRIDGQIQYQNDFIDFIIWADTVSGVTVNADSIYTRVATVTDNITLGDDVNNTSGMINMVASDGDTGRIYIHTDNSLYIDGVLAFKLDSTTGEENRFAFVPGGSGGSSTFSMYNHTGSSKTVLLHSAGVSYFTGGSLAIGTATADSLLTVAGSGHFTGDLVVDGEISGTFASIGEMTLFENAVETTIEADEQWHGADGLTAGLLDGWTFDAGGTVDILSFADYSGTVAGTIKATTDGAHSLITGDIVCLVGSDIEVGDANAYTGVYEITVVDADEYYFTNASWNATTTAVSINPSTLIAGANAAGNYLYTGSASMASAGVNKVYDFALFVNDTQSEKVNARVRSNGVGEFSSVTGTGSLVISVGDVVWFGVEGITDATNFTMRFANAFIHKL